MSELMEKFKNLTYEETIKLQDTYRIYVINDMIAQFHPGKPFLAKRDLEVKMDQWQMLEYLKNNPDEQIIDCDNNIIQWKYGYLYKNSEPFEINLNNGMVYRIKQK